MAASAGETAGPSPTALIRAAVEALDQRFFEPLAVPALLRDAWEGAAAALTRAGVSPVPPAPAYPTEPRAAYSLHEETFPGLERLTADQLGTEALAVAALDELLARRRDGHTALGPRRRTSSPVTPDPSSPAGWAVGTLGLVLTDSPPLAIADVRRGARPSAPASGAARRWWPSTGTRRRTCGARGPAPCSTGARARPTRSPSGPLVGRPQRWSSGPNGCRCPPPSSSPPRPARSACCAWTGSPRPTRRPRPCARR